MGDANLDGNKWREDDYGLKRVVSPLIEVLDVNGLVCHQVGNTYQADHAQANGNIAESALDHVYTPINLK